VSLAERSLRFFAFGAVGMVLISALVSEGALAAPPTPSPAPSPESSPAPETPAEKSSHISESRSVIQAELQWIDEQGISGKLPFRYAAKWTLLVEQEQGLASTVRRPFYKLELTPPDEYQLDSIEPQEVDPRFRLIRAGDRATLLLVRKLSKFKVSLSRTRNGKRETIQGSMLVRFSPAEPALWTLGTCAEMGWSWMPLAPSEEGRQNYAPLYLAVSDCEVDKKGQMQATLLWPSDATLLFANSVRRNHSALLADLEKKKGVQQGTQSAILASVDGAARVRFGQKMEFELQERTGANETLSRVMQVLFDPARKVPRFTGMAGAGFSFLAYSEEPFGIEKSFLAVTAKGGVNYWVVPSHVDLAFSGYFSATPFTLSSSAAGEVQPSAHFYGLNIRSGYQLTPDQHHLGPWQLKVSIGYYFWGMVLPPGTYGVTMAAGPQFFVSLGSIPGRKTWGVYFKIAPISDDPLAASLRSRELAVGASMGVPWFGKKAPWFIALDLAQTEMRFSQATNVIGLTAVAASLGRIF
jgi:hypothetical protein